MFGDFFGGYSSRDSKWTNVNRHYVYRKMTDGNGKKVDREIFGNGSGSRGCLWIALGVFCLIWLLGLLSR